MINKVKRSVGFFTQKKVFKDKGGKGRVGRFQASRLFFIGAFGFVGYLVHKLEVIERDNVVYVRDLIGEN